MENQPSTFAALFFRVWMKPREVMRDILASQPGYHVWTLVVLDALTQSFVPEYYFTFAGREDVSLLVSFGLVLSIGLDTAALLVFSGIWFLVGKLTGGKGDWRALRTAFAWSLPPGILGQAAVALGGIPLWLRILSGEIDTASLVACSLNPLTAVCAAIFLVSAFWNAVLMVANVAEAHRVSLSHSFLLVVMSMVMLGVASFLVSFLAAVFFAVHFLPH